MSSCESNKDKNCSDLHTHTDNLLYFRHFMIIWRLLQKISYKTFQPNREIQKLLLEKIQKSLVK